MFKSAPAIFAAFALAGSVFGVAAAQVAVPQAAKSSSAKTSTKPATKTAHAAGVPLVSDLDISRMEIVQPERRGPYKHIGPGWVQSPLSDAEQIRRFGRIVTPAVRGGAEFAREPISPELREKMEQAVASRARLAPERAGIAPTAPPAPPPATPCEEVTAARVVPAYQFFQPIGPAPMAGLDDLNSPQTFLDNEYWSQMPATGALVAVACEPELNDPTPLEQSVLVGSIGGGMWRSADSLATPILWNRVSDATYLDRGNAVTAADTFGLSDFGTIEYFPGDSSTVYAADGSFFYFSESSGIYRADDGGTAKWLEIGTARIVGTRTIIDSPLPSDSIVTAILIDPSDRNHIWVGYSDGNQEKGGLLELQVQLKPLPGRLNRDYYDVISRVDVERPSQWPFFPPVTGLKMTSFGVPMVAIQSRGLYLQLPGDNRLLTDQVIGRDLTDGAFLANGQDLARVMLDSSPDGNIWFALGVNTDGQVGNALRCTDPGLAIWEVLPKGRVIAASENETPDQGLPNALDFFGGVTGFISLNPFNTNQAFLGGQSPFFADAGLAATYEFRTPIDNDFQLKRPTWYETTRSLEKPFNTMTVDDQAKRVRSLHTRQNAAAWDRAGNMWIAHEGGVAMLLADNIGRDKAPSYVDRNGTSATISNDLYFTPGPLNISHAMSAHLSPHDAKRIVVATRNNGAAEMVFSYVNGVGNTAQSRFPSINGVGQLDPTQNDPTAVRDTFLGDEVGDIRFDLRPRLGSDNGPTQPAQLYMYSSNEGMLRRNGRDVMLEDVFPDDELDTTEIKAGTFGDVNGNFQLDATNAGFPLLQFRAIPPKDEPDPANPINVKNDAYFSGLMTAGTRIWMIADPTQLMKFPYDVDSRGHAVWNATALPSSLILIRLPRNRVLLGAVSALGLSNDRDMSSLWFTTTFSGPSRGRLCRMDQRYTIEADTETKVFEFDTTTLLPKYEAAAAVYPPAGEGPATGAPYDVVVNPKNPLEAYVCFLQSSDDPRAVTDVLYPAARVARVAKVTIVETKDPDTGVVTRSTVVRSLSSPFGLDTTAGGGETLLPGIRPTKLGVLWNEKKGGNDVVYLGTNVGLWLTTDGGRTWDVADPMIPFAYVTDVHLVDDKNPKTSERSINNGMVAAAFFGAGVWVGQSKLPECIADFDRNGFVDGDDNDLFIKAFENSCPEADLDGDTQITSDDFDLFVENYQDGCAD